MNPRSNFLMLLLKMQIILRNVSSVTLTEFSFRNNNLIIIIIIIFLQNFPLRIVFCSLSTKRSLSTMRSQKLRVPSNIFRGTKDNEILMENFRVCRNLCFNCFVVVALCFRLYHAKYLSCSPMWQKIPENMHRARCLSPGSDTFPLLINNG